MSRIVLPLMLMALTNLACVALTEETRADDTRVASAAEDKDGPLVCETESETGSNIRHEVCHHVRQRTQEEEAATQQMLMSQQNAQTRGGR